MRFLLRTVAVGLLTAVCCAQTPAPCPASRPVDDLVTEIHKQQSKMKHRNKDPLPDVTCVWGWCREHKQTNPTFPNPPAVELPKDQSDSSSSKSTVSTVDPCDLAMDQALEAAHSVEVGDFNFEKENYRGALMRYQDADQRKPDDIAIQVRLGRAYEKLHDNANAIARYKAALKLQGPEKWSKEAEAALHRLQA